jgi:hypothetical protein
MSWADKRESRRPTEACAQKSPINYHFYSYLRTFYLGWRPKMLETFVKNLVVWFAVRLLSHLAHGCP